MNCVPQTTAASPDDGNGLVTSSAFFKPYGINVLTTSKLIWSRISQIDARTVNVVDNKKNMGELNCQNSNKYVLKKELNSTDLLLL